MNILIVNDDSINAPGIEILANSKRKAPHFRVELCVSINYLHV